MSHGGLAAENRRESQEVAQCVMVKIPVAVRRRFIATFILLQLAVFVSWLVWARLYSRRSHKSQTSTTTPTALTPTATARCQFKMTFCVGSGVMSHNGEKWLFKTLLLFFCERNKSLPSTKMQLYKATGHCSWKSHTGRPLKISQRFVCTERRELHPRCVCVSFSV